MPGTHRQGRRGRLCLSISLESCWVGATWLHFPQMGTCFPAPESPPSPHVGNPAGSWSSEPRRAEAGGPPAPAAHRLGMEMPSPGSSRQRTREMTTERHTPAPSHRAPQTSPPDAAVQSPSSPPAPTHLRALSPGQLHPADPGTRTPKLRPQHRGQSKRRLQRTDQKHPQFCPKPLPAGEVPSLLSLASQSSLAGLRVKLSAPKELQERPSRPGTGCPQGWASPSRAGQVHPGLGWKKTPQASWTGHRPCRNPPSCQREPTLEDDRFAQLSTP